MTQLFSLLSRVPGVAKYLTVVILLVGLLGFVYLRYGLVPTVVLAVGLLSIYVFVRVYRNLLKRRERQKGLAFGQALDAADAGPDKEEVKDAVKALSNKWKEAQENLRKRKIDIYQLPWYMLIGEPQSGKSTTLEFSGLRFPLGRDSVSGGGGTRNCDWWFTEEGVILDTAGRFTFHEEARPDAEEWDHFLNLLGKHRPYCPINGVILVIPTDALLETSKDEIEKKAQNISNQLLHIQKRLAIQFPVYVMVTKCDKVYGFVQFFNKLTPDQQREMFGWSAGEENEGFDPVTFEDSFTKLHKRIEDARLRHFSQPQFLEDPDKIYTFAEEFEALREPLRHYMELIFRPSVYKDPLFFRGYYFCSGMQEGQPIVSAARSMMPSTSMIARLEQIFTKSRAFFVRDIYATKVFPEEGLVRRAREHERMDTLKRRFVWGANGLFLVLGALFLWGLHRDLNGRLSQPLKVIEQVTADLDQNQGTFFTSPADRALVYQRLSQLKAGLVQDQGGGFFALFGGDQNAMTEPLDDTFAYLYMDRFLLGLFRETNAQLRAFQLAAPPQPRNSRAELDTLLAALSQLKLWQVGVNEGNLADFEPDIKPFLALVLDPVWEGELAQWRPDRPLSEELAFWFDDVYKRASPKVRNFLVESMVGLWEGGYDQLSRRIVNFYHQQPELLAYQEKVAQIGRMEIAYDGLSQTTATWEGHHEKMMAMTGFFDDETQALMAQSDHYLPFSVVRDDSIDALGSEFTDMRPKSVEESTLASARKLLNNPERERAKLKPAISFVNLLLAVTPDQLSDPRAGLDAAEGEVPGLGYPPVIFDFWTRLLQPYSEKLVGEDDPYAAAVAAVDLESGLRLTCETGRNRVNTMVTLLQNQMVEHVALIEDKSRQKRFEGTFNDFYDALLAQEQQRVGHIITGVLTGENLNVDPPPGRWSAYMRAYRDHSSNGKDFAWFTSGPERVAKLLRRNHERELRTIYNNTAKPYEEIETYIAEAHKHLTDCYDVLITLEGIPAEELARNRNRYRNAVPGERKLSAIADIKEVPVYLEAHRQSVKVWGEGALSAFRSFVNVADPCPACHGEYKRLREAVAGAGLGFPMRFDETTQSIAGRQGELNISAQLAEPEKLDVVLAALETYRNPSELQQSYLRKKGVQALVDQALAWADGVRQLQAGGLTTRFLITHKEVGEGKGISDVFTYARLEGRWQGKREILLTTPRITDVVANPDGEGVQLVLFNKDSGNQARAVIRFADTQTFLAFGLGGHTENNQQFIRDVLFNLNFSASQKASGVFRLETSIPLPPPPDWSRVLER